MPPPVSGDEGRDFAEIPFRRLLVTGADGFVGRHLLPLLERSLASDAKVFVATRKHGGDERDILFDLADPESIAAAVEQVKPDLIVHLAAQSSVGQSIDGAIQTWAVNAGGTLALATAVARHAPNSTFFFVSSSDVYGLAFNDGIVTEQTPPQPQSAYARSKMAAEWLLADSLPIECRLIIVRPSNHSGPGQDERFVIPAFAAQIARIERGVARDIQVGNLEAKRDFLDVRDVVAGYVQLLSRSDRLPQRNLFNIASGIGFEISEILKMLREMSSAKTVTRSDPMRVRSSEVPSAAIDARAFRETVGWRPTRSISETLAAVIEDQRELLTRGGHRPSLTRC